MKKARNDGLLRGIVEKFLKRKIDYFLLKK